jgi:hypothetical protein
MELALIGILAVLASLCVAGEMRSLRYRRQAVDLSRLRSVGRATNRSGVVALFPEHIAQDEHQVGGTLGQPAHEIGEP